MRERENKRERARETETASASRGEWQRQRASRSITKTIFTVQSTHALSDTGGKPPLFSWDKKYYRVRIEWE